MKIKIQQFKLEKFSCDFLVVKWVQGQKMDGSTGAVDKALHGLIGKMIKEQEFKGKEGEMLVFPTFGKIPAKKVMVIGLGEQKSVTVDVVRRAMARIVKEARRQHAKRVATILLGTGTAKIEPSVAAQAMTEGALLGAYAYTKYKSQEAKQDLIYPAELVIITAGTHETSKLSEAEKIRTAQRGIREGELSSQAAIFARELVNEPASSMTPKNLTDAAVALAKGVSGMTVKIYRRPQIEKMGMGAYLGVAKGSDHEPYFVHLTYKSGIGPRSKKIAIVGKGITFDSGGLSLKPSQAMESMKVDMAGCAAMLGVFSVLPKLKLQNIEVHGISAICENMPSGRAMKPGDIVRAMNGKTIEVLNTDAEGRLTLADALTYAVRLQPDYIIDLATLTGACVAALGEEVAGYMGNNREFLEKLKKASENSGEKIWELPLVEEYRQFTKSQVADLSNITPGMKGSAGAITAGLFLEEFVVKQPWAHIDIAGPAWAEKDVNPWAPKGGTGCGVRTILEFLKSL